MPSGPISPMVQWLDTGQACKTTHIPPICAPGFCWRAGMTLQGCVRGIRSPGRLLVGGERSDRLGDLPAVEIDGHADGAARAGQLRRRQGRGWQWCDARSGGEVEDLGAALTDERGRCTART